MPQFIIPKQNISDNKFVIDDPSELNHLVKVLRARPGEKIYLFDGICTHYIAEIREVSKSSISGEIIKEIPYKKRKFTLRVFASLIKFDRFELLLEKLTEVGVDEIIPIITDRTSVKISKPAMSSKTERWKKVIIAAVKQCNCCKIPEFGQVTNFKEAFKFIKSEDLNLIAYESESPDNSLKALLTRPPCDNKRDLAHLRRADSPTHLLTCVNLFIGPEGGFTGGEIQLAKAQGLKFFSLGSNILRAETAAVAAASIILYELNQ